jgi:hypothetical protein
MEKPTIPTNDGNAGAVQNTTLPPSEQTDANKNPQNSTDDNSSTQGEEGKTAEQLKAERATAIQEAVRNSKEAKEAKAQLKYYETSLKVAKDPNTLISINEEDPDMAEKIAQELYGKSYLSLLNGEQSDDTENMTEADLYKLFKKFQEKEGKVSVEQQIENEITGFFASKNIMPGTPLFKKIYEEVSDMRFTDPKQAKRMLNAVFLETQSAEEQAPSNNAPAMFAHNPMGKNKNGTQVSEAMRDLLKQRGISEDKFQSFVKKSN